MRRSSVLHKNNPTYSFLLEGFNLWKHVLFKQIEIDNPSNGALTKEKGTNNTNVQKPTPDVQFWWTSNVLVNFIRLLCSPNAAVVSINTPIHIKCCLVRKTNVLLEGFFFINGVGHESGKFDTFWSVIRFDFLLQLNLVSMEPQALVKNILNGSFWNP